MIKNDSYKFYFLIILFVVVFGIFIFGKGTYSSSIGSDDIIFDYSLEIDEQNKMIKFLTRNTKVLDIINKISVTDGLSLDVSVTNSDGDIKDNTSIINTGDVLLVNINNNEFKYGLSVIADGNGDGRISLTDLAQLRRHIVGYIDDNTGTVYKKDGLYYHALDMNRDGKLSLVDFAKVSRMIVGTEEIYSIKLKEEEIKLNVDETLQLEYYISPSDVTNKSVVWSSSNKNVVTVSNGLVKAVGEGEAEIAVISSNGLSAKCNVVVKNVESPMLNKVIEANIDGFRDPFVLIDNSVYYMYGTGWKAYKNTSGSLDGTWEKINNVVTVPENATKDKWAPEVYKYNGYYYMFTTYYSSKTSHRGCSVMRSNSPEGPFVEISDGHVTPSNWDAIDGTLYIDDDGQPWMVFVHEWTSTSDGVGRMAVAKLSKDLTSFISEPVELFKANSASWVGYTITDGCWMYKTKDGQLLMLWSNLDKSKGYAVGIARSKSGNVTGPWTHDSELLYSKAISGKYDGGHGMIFMDTNGQMYLSIHAPNTATDTRKERATFVPIYETNGTLKIVK